MRISDWSSDVCSSDLGLPRRAHRCLVGRVACIRLRRRPEIDDRLRERQFALRGAEPLVSFPGRHRLQGRGGIGQAHVLVGETQQPRSEEHTSELQSLMRTSYAVFCLKKKTHYIMISK